MVFAMMLGYLVCFPDVLIASLSSCAPGSTLVKLLLSAPPSLVLSAILGWRRISDAKTLREPFLFLIHHPQERSFAPTLEDDCRHSDVVGQLAQKGVLLQRRA